MEPIPGPPPRAALDLLPPGRPSDSTELVPPVARFAEIPAVVGDSAKPDVDDDGDGDRVVAVLGELTSPTIAGDLVTFIDKLVTPRDGLAFLLLWIRAPIVPQWVLRVTK